MTHHAIGNQRNAVCSLHASRMHAQTGDRVDEAVRACVSAATCTAIQTPASMGRTCSACRSASAVRMAAEAPNFVRSTASGTLASTVERIVHMAAQTCMHWGAALLSHPSRRSRRCSGPHAHMTMHRGDHTFSDTDVDLLWAFLSALKPPLVLALAALPGWRPASRASQAMT